MLTILKLQYLKCSESSNLWANIIKVAVIKNIKWTFGPVLLNSRCKFMHTCMWLLFICYFFLTDCSEHLCPVTTNHDWLLALPVSLCGLKLTDDAVHMAVSLRLGCSVYTPHTCRSGALIDAQGLHSLSCKQAPSKTVRHNAINDVIVLSLSSAGILATKEPTRLTSVDGKHPDGLTLIPWQSGKPLAWDITVVSTLAAFCFHASSHQAGSARELAASQKEAKYSCLLFVS